MSKIQEYMKKHQTRNRFMITQAPTVVLGDGVTMSVQASEYHYCSPKNNNGPWESFEIGFPSEHLPELDEFGGCEDVCGWVPEDVINSIIEAHGGTCTPQKK